MAKPLSGNRLQDNGTIIRGLNVLAWSHISLIENTYVVGSKSFRPDQLFKVTEIKQLC